MTTFDRTRDFSTREALKAWFVAEYVMEAYENNVSSTFRVFNVESGKQLNTIPAIPNFFNVAVAKNAPTYIELDQPSGNVFLRLHVQDPHVTQPPGVPVNDSHYKVNTAMCISDDGTMFVLGFDGPSFKQILRVYTVDVAGKSFSQKGADIEVNTHQYFELRGTMAMQSSNTLIVFALQNTNPTITNPEIYVYAVSTITPDKIAYVHRLTDFERQFAFSPFDDQELAIAGAGGVLIFYSFRSCTITKRIVFDPAALYIDVKGVTFLDSTKGMYAFTYSYVTMDAPTRTFAVAQIVAE